MSVNIAVIFPFICLVYIGFFFKNYAKRDKDSVARRLEDPVRLGFPLQIHPMRRQDAVPLALIVGVYALIAFFGLGDRAAPSSFCHFEDRGRYVLIELRTPQPISNVMYYSGLYSGNYYLQFSQDGEEFIDQATMPQSYADLFKWHDPKLVTPESEPFTVKYLRIIAGSELEMGELAIFDRNGKLMSAYDFIFDDGAATLFDEQQLIPDKSTYLNSAYFDEIYHARTAYEHFTNVYPYEISHPPLGKIIISIGIALFGMNPFGWRFMGTLIGVLMLPCLYILIKNLFGSTTTATCGTIVFAFDFMHFVQTRIATIDSYAVFFIILMYMFMYRFLCANPDETSAVSRLIPLFLSGLSFGLGAASKWTCIYAGAGLAVLWLLYWIYRGRDLFAAEKKKQFRNEFFTNVAWCVLFFIAVPLLVYYLSYYPYGKAIGLNGFEMFFKPEYAQTMLDNQKFMFTYHRDVVAEHPYSSRWYQWVFNLRPILYYLDYGSDSRASFGAFVNPLLCWAGLGAIGLMSVYTVTRRDGRALFILVGYLAQLVPWIPINRLTFEYHYFPCTVFLTLALCHIFATFTEVRQQADGGARHVYAFSAGSAALLFVFYPILTGVSIPSWYSATFLRWIPKAWPF